MGRVRLYRMAGIAVGILAIGLLANRMAPPLATAWAAPQLPGTVADQLGVAADALDAALRPGGSGLTFEVVQRNTLYAKPGGPRIELRSPDDPTQVVEVVESYYVNAIVTRGAVTPHAFWMDMRRGPAEGQTADFEHSLGLASVIEGDGLLWRNDGAGWYVTDVSPGMGMDPASARLLPQLLRELAAPEPLQDGMFDGRLLAGIGGDTAPNLYPGVLASDARDSTAADVDIECWLDDTGRLVRLVSRARNLNQTTYDLIGETVITFDYGPPGDPPEPDPTMAPEPLPTNAPGDLEVAS